MSFRSRALSRAMVRAAVAAAATTALSVSLLQATGDSPTRPADTSTDVALTNTGNPPTPGNFRGFGFDQCLTPTQWKMNRWLNRSPFLAVGVYISGDSRGCRNQPNLTPTWVSTQLRRGWKLLPITLGPQASCSTRFPRYGDDETIRPWPGAHGRYWWARQQGVKEAEKSVTEARRLGIVRRSTLYYDLEAYDNTNWHCRESALAFLTAWTWRINALGYKSGVYSSAGSGLKALDDARVNRPRAYRMPDQIWIARWDGVANTSTSYLRNDGWRPGGRLKQYRGGHDETHGGVRINIDSNYVALGRGMYAPPRRHCGGVRVDWWRYQVLRPAWTGATQYHAHIKTLQCLLTEAGHYNGPINGRYWNATRAAANAWKAAHGFGKTNTWWRTHWVSLLSQGNRDALKFGSAGPDVRRAQRALNAADWGLRRWPDGRYTRGFARAVGDYQERVGLDRTGIINTVTWMKLQRGRM